MRPRLLGILLLAVGLPLALVRAGGPGVAALSGDPVPAGPRAELLAKGLSMPANLAFAPDGRLFLTEVSLGRVRVIEHDELRPEPFAVVDEPARKEAGLLGLTLDPDFATNHYVYLYYSQNRPDEVKPRRNRVVRFTDAGGRGTDLQVVLDDLAIGDKEHNGGHNGGRLGFGPDGKLYVTTGDVSDDASAQDPDKLTGKLLRLNPDGSVPSDNPTAGSAVYALGLRNAWGLAFHPLTGLPYVTENGATHHDEVNRIVPDGNYGWPKVQGAKGDERFLDPLWDSGDERGGITGLAFYTGSLFPEYEGDLLFCRFAPPQLVRLRLAGPDFATVQEEAIISDKCGLDVATGPDGAIYVSNYTEVYRLTPGT